jgi:AraC-like DNA-binding protein
LTKPTFYVIISTKKGGDTVKLVYFGESAVITRYSKHKHECTELALAIKGNINVILDGKSYEIKPGDLMIIPPNTYHEGFGGTDYMDIFLHVENMDFYDTAIIHDYDGSINTLLLMIKRITNEKEANYEAISEKLLDAASEYVKKYLEKELKYDFVAKLKNRIYENFETADFDITAEIKSLGFNVDYFRRCFKEDLGCTPHEYLTTLRIDKAKKLLTQRSFKSVETVSALCGFTDNFYFSKKFKQHTGYSPREYRKQFFTV